MSSHEEDFGGWPSLLTTLTDGEDLTTDEARAVLETVLAGEATDGQIAALIVALRTKGETVDELVGMVEAMLSASAPLDLPEGTIDIVGTGGGPTRQTAALNVSTMAAIVAASAGALVCKHGNRRASSTSGSFDLLDELGVEIDLDGEAVRVCVDSAGVGFCYARGFHSAMRHAGPVRRELGIPTVFNVLGPLSHPGRVRRQVIGVVDPSLLDRVAQVLAVRGAEHALVVHGWEGLDEITTTGPTEIRRVRDGEIDAITIEPEDVGLSRVNQADLVGGDAKQNAAIFQEIMDGEPSARRDIVVLNAGAGLVVAGIVDDFADGVAEAQRAIDDGRTRATLTRLVEAAGA